MGNENERKGSAMMNNIACPEGPPGVSAIIRYESQKTSCQRSLCSYLNGTGRTQCSQSKNNEALLF
jgi:hypothetical protein